MSGLKCGGKYVKGSNVYEPMTSNRSYMTETNQEKQLYVPRKTNCPWNATHGQQNIKILPSPIARIQALETRVQRFIPEPLWPLLHVYSRKTI